MMQGVLLIAANKRPLLAGGNSLNRRVEGQELGSKNQQQYSHLDQFNFKASGSQSP